MIHTKHKRFKKLYDEIALPLTKFLVKRSGGNQEIVDEVFSRTIEATWRSYKTFEHKSKFFTWVCRIALNKMADYYRDQVNRKSGIVVPILENLAETSYEPSYEEKLSIEEMRADIRACVNLLPQETRRLLYLKFWKDLTYEQIGKILGLSERSVEGKLYRAKQTLSSKLRDRSID